MTFVLFLMFLAVCMGVHPCTQHLSSCRNCLGDSNGCSFCQTAPGLGQCLAPADSLIGICSAFISSNQTKLITALAQCPDASSKAELCAAHSTENTIHCADCVGDTTNGCAWCGTASTGSCNTNGNGASNLCSLLLGGTLLTSSASVSSCPSNTVPNYCVAYTDCATCNADASCSFCLSFDKDTCTSVKRCVAKTDRTTSCTANAALFRPAIIGPAPDLNIQCDLLPTTCEELDAMTGTTTGAAGGATTTGAGGSTAAGGATTTVAGATLPIACDDSTLADVCLQQCHTAANVATCKCVSNKATIVCADSPTTAPVATSAAGRLSSPLSFLFQR